MREGFMDRRYSLLYRREKTLFAICLVISLLAWIALSVASLGIGLLYIAIGMLLFVFAHSAFIAYLKGTAVKITAEQFPDLHKRIVEAAAKIGQSPVPDAYLMHADGAFNALATRFLGRNFLVLYSDIVDALEDQAGAIDFYIGHELGHIHRGHLKWLPLLIPSRMLPLIGAAYSRAREYTCDRYGFAVCERPEDALRGMAALAAGAKRWKTLDLDRYIAQQDDSRGFWMSFNELLSPYPWLVKRAAALRSLALGAEATSPGRHVLSWPVAFFGGGAGVAGVAIVGVAVVAVFAAPKLAGVLPGSLLSGAAGLGGGSSDPFATLGGPVAQYGTAADPGTAAPSAIPQVQSAIEGVATAKAAVETFVTKSNEWPKDNAAAGVPAASADYGPEVATVTVTDGVLDVLLANGKLAGKSIRLTSDVVDGKITWTCSSKDVSITDLLLACEAH